MFGFRSGGLDLISCGFKTYWKQHKIFLLKVFKSKLLYCKKGKPCGKELRMVSNSWERCSADRWQVYKNLLYTTLRKWISPWSWTRLETESSIEKPPDEAVPWQTNWLQFYQMPNCFQTSDLQKLWDRVLFEGANTFGYFLNKPSVIKIYYKYI